MLCLGDHLPGTSCFHPGPRRGPPPLPARMPLNAAGLRFPHDRVLLARTKLAYVHLRNLLTDAKRDRAARVFGYVAIWLPEGILVLYLQEGEVVNATHSVDGDVW